MTNFSTDDKQLPLFQPGREILVQLKDPQAHPYSAFIIVPEPQRYG